MSHLDFDVAHLLAGSLVLVSFILLYQDRLYALLNVYAVHALVLALSVAWKPEYVGGVQPEHSGPPSGVAVPHWVL